MSSKSTQPMQVQQKQVRRFNGKAKEITREQAELIINNARSETIAREITFRDYKGKEEVRYVEADRGTDYLTIFGAIEGASIEDYTLPNGKIKKWGVKFEGQEITVEDMQLRPDDKGLAYINVEFKKRYLSWDETGVLESGKDTIQDDRDKTRDFGKDTQTADFDSNDLEKKKKGSCSREEETTELKQLVFYFEIDDSDYYKGEIITQKEWIEKPKEIIVHPLSIQNNYSINVIIEPHETRKVYMEYFTRSGPTFELHEILNTYMNSGQKYSEYGITPAKNTEYERAKVVETAVSREKIIYSEFKEEESPIIRCIMDPAFRKIYGAMYGFIDPEEYTAGETKSEPVKYEKGFNTDKKDDKKKPKELKRTEKTEEQPKFEYNPEKKDTEKTETKRKNSGDNKSKKRKKERKIPKEPPKIRKGKEKIARIWRNKRFEGIKTPKIGEMRKLEEFLGKEFKMSKVKIEKFKLMMNKISEEIKQEIKLLILKVQEFFKLKENLMEIKNELNKNWILNYTKIELRKIFVEIEYKVQTLKKEISKMLNKIKIRVRNNTNFVLRLGDKVKTLRKLERLLLFFLLFRDFNEN